MRTIPCLILVVLCACTPGETPSDQEEGGAAPPDGFATADGAGSYPEPPPGNRWPAGTSEQRTPGGVPVVVAVPAGDTIGALLVVGGWSVKQIGVADGAITIAVQGDGTLGPRACGGAGMSGVPHLLSAANVRDVLLAAAANVRFDHRRVFIEGDGNNAGWGVEAALDPQNQPYITGVYVPWAEYNNAPCRGVTAAATPLSPRVLFISAGKCDDTYCPLKSCVEQVRARGYDVTFRDPLTPAECDCRGACPGAIARPHYRGPGDASSIRAWVLGQRR